MGRVSRTRGRYVWLGPVVCPFVATSRSCFHAVLLTRLHHRPLIHPSCVSDGRAPFRLSQQSVRAGGGASESEPKFAARPSGHRAKPWAPAGSRRRPRGRRRNRGRGGEGRGLARTRMRSPRPAGTRAGRARFRVTHLLCFFFLSLSLPALRTHNLTVLPSHNSASVPANDSAYSNLSATVGEHVPVPHPPAARRGPRSRPRPVPSGSV